MFSNAKVGDRVWSFKYSWGTIREILPNNKYQMIIQFDFNHIISEYTFDGKELLGDKNPTLFWDEIKFEIPEKPFDLEKELRKLEIVEFKLEKDNYFLVWSNKLKCINSDYLSSYQNPFLICFTEESLKNFMDNIKDKEITKEQFFTAYKNVFGGIINE